MALTPSTREQWRSLLRKQPQVGRLLLEAAFNVESIHPFLESHLAQVQELSTVFDRPKDRAHRSRQEWQNVLKNNPNITQLAREAIEDIEALHAILESTLNLAQEVIEATQLDQNNEN